MTQREPDRFEAKARELVRRVDGMTYGHSDDERADVIAAALRQAESSALERAAQVADNEACQLDQGNQHIKAAHRIADKIRALIPPAAAPAAEPDVCVGSEYIGGYLVPRYAPAADYDPITAPIPEGDMNGPHGPLPKGETGKAQGAEADDTNVPDDIDPRNFEKYDADARQRIAELEAALREAQGQLCAEHCEWTGTGEHDDQCVKLSKALAARVAPPDREGK